MAGLTGIVLAAGAGTRMGGPKALLRDSHGRPWVALAVQNLLAAGCDDVIVVLGAQATDAAALVPPQARVVEAPRWALGMGESLRAGLAAALGHAALVTLVDLPDMPASVLARIVESPVGQDSLRQAVFEGRPGHPVLIGSAHWAAVSATLSGDRGARAYLVSHGVREVECGDLFDGHDVDTAPSG